MRVLPRRKPSAFETAVIEDRRKAVVLCQESTVVFKRADGGYIRFTVLDDTSHQSDTGVAVRLSCVALWTDTTYEGSPLVTSRTLHKPSPMRTTEYPDLPVTSVFFSWAGLRDALMLDHRIHEDVRSRLKRHHEELLNKRLENRHRRMPMDDRRAVLDYLAVLRVGDLHYLPELPVDLQYVHKRTGTARW